MQMLKTEKDSTKKAKKVTRRQQNLEKKLNIKKCTKNVNAPRGKILRLK